MLKIVMLSIVLAACGDDARPNPVRSITWSTGTSDSPGVPAPVICTDIVSHPCPWLLYTKTAIVDEAAHTFTWTDASGGANDIGVDASAYPDVVENMVTSASASTLIIGTIKLPQRGDDGGLRHALALTPTADGGWAGDVTWTLFTVAGNTTFHLVVEP